MIAPEPVRFIGRCKRCKTTRRLEPHLVELREISLGYGGRREIFYRWEVDGVTVRGTRERFYADCGPCVAALAHLPPNGRPYRHVEYNRIEGRLGVQECGAKCMGAKGPACECKCRGANHGGAFA